MRDSPPLFSICLQNIARLATEGHDMLHDISELPSDMIEYLLMNMPPLALQSIHEKLVFNSIQSLKCGSCDRKRGRDINIGSSWRKLFKSRWPGYSKNKQLDESSSTFKDADSCKSIKCDTDWQQLYWEVHMQNCLDEVSEIALLPGFSGRLGDVEISDNINKHLGYCGSTWLKSHDYARLSHHCKLFGHHLRNVRLQNVLCVAEIRELFSTSQLQNVIFCNIRSKNHVDGVYSLLHQNKSTLSSVKFLHCKLPPHALSEICDCMATEGTEHTIKHLSFVSSSVFGKNTDSLTRFLKFLSSGRLLVSVKFLDVQMEPKFGRFIFDSLCYSSSSLCALEISDNNMRGWLSTSPEGTHSKNIPLKQHIPALGLQTLQVINLRANNLSKDDAGDIKNVLLAMPKLTELDLSDNPLTDDGIRLLLPYFAQTFKESHFLARVKLENCSLSAAGVGELLMTLSSIEQPLSYLSIADNNIGSCIGGALAKFLRVPSVNSLNIESVGLGSSGFLDFENELPGNLQLAHLNMSKNRGGIAAARFLSKVLSSAPDLLYINAAHNFLPSESLDIICAALKQAKGKLRTLDLTGNDQLNKKAKADPDLEKFTYLNKPIVILPSPAASLSMVYDDDP